MDGYGKDNATAELELELLAGVVGVPTRTVRDEGDGDGGDGDGDGQGSGAGSGDGDGQGSGAGDGSGDGGDGTGGARTYDEAYVKKLRDEAAARRVRERELEEKLKTLEAKDLSEKERAEKERDDAKAAATAATERAKQALLKAEVLHEARDTADPETVLELVKGKVQFDDDGNPVGVAEAVKELLEAKPFLNKTEGGAGGGNTKGAGGGSGNGHRGGGAGKLTLAALQAMSTAEVMQLESTPEGKAEVDRVLAGG